MDQPWVIVLAGGEGSRIRSMTRAPDGTPVPKQFCRLRDGLSLFHRAVARALSLTCGARVVPVLRAHHRPWWERDLRGIAPDILVVQRDGRGTATAVHRALTAIAARDPRAVVLILPSDHVVEDETRFRAAAGRLCREARSDPWHLFLLGVLHREPDPAYGWIVPGTDPGTGIRRVVTFVEKPTREQARALVARGAVVNALVVAATAGPFLAMLERQVSEPAGAARGGNGDAAPGDWDLSRDFLSRSTSRLRVLSVPALGWCDLGTPDRLRRWMEQKQEFFWWTEEVPRSMRDRARIVQPLQE